ncbi:hypothetical protein Hanom_Chr01g00049901 [Helianthus anomalus]
MVKIVEWDKKLKHNQNINLEQVPQDFQDVARWIKSSRIGYAVETEVPIIRIHIQEFCQTAKPETINKARGIYATVRNKRVVVTEERIRRVVKLGDNAQDPIILSKDDVLDGFHGMGYVGDFRQKKEIKRNGLTRDWRFIVHAISMSIAHRKGGYDGLNLEWSRAMLNSCLNQKFNLSDLIFKYMLENTRGNTWAMYPRFIQMLIDDQYDKLPHEGGLFTFHVPTSRLYTEIKTNEWVMLHDWMYTAERLPLVKEAYKKYRAAVQEKQQRIAQAKEEAAETEEQLKRKRKGKQVANDEHPKKKKSSENLERPMGASFRASESEEHRQHIQDMRKIHEMQEKEKREKRLERREMSESERPVVVTEEEQTLDDFFFDTLLTDPEEISASKSTPPKKKSTGEGPSRFPQVKPTRISKPPVPPQRIGPTSAKEICLLKNQVNDTNILREKLKDQRKKNREMHAYVTGQSQYIRFQQHGIEKLYKMMKKICAKIEIEPMFSFAYIFDFEAFKEEEANWKKKEAETKKHRLESTEKVTEGDESDEEEIDRDEMPAKFIEWGLEEEVMYEQEDGKTFTPQHPEWFKKEREKLPDFYQVVTVGKTEATDKIISWMYRNFKGMFVVKRRGGVIQYFQTRYDLFSLPRWDLRELGRLDMLNPEDRSVGGDFERIIAKECNKGFPNFKPQRPRRRVSKTTKDPITGKGKLPEEVPVCLNKFKKWFYDSHTCEAVIRSTKNEDIRILDPMDVFMFGLSNLTVLNASRINVGAGNANLEEAMLFQRAVERAWKIKREMFIIVDKIEKRKEADEKKKEERKKKKHERKKEKSYSTKEPTTTSQTTSSPPASSTYEAIMEEPPSTSEAILTQETSATTIEVQATPEATGNEEVPPEPEEKAANNPVETTEE